MSIEKWDEILQANASLVEEVGDLLEYLADLKDSEDRSFDITAVIHGTEGSTAEASSRILAINGVIEKYKGDSKLELVSDSILQQMLDAINTATSNSQALLSHLRSHFTSSITLVKFNYDNFHGQKSDGQNVNFQPQFKQFYVSVDEILKSYNSLVPLLSTSHGDFLAAAKSFAELLGKVVNDRDEVRETFTQLKDLVAKAENLHASLEAASTEVNRLKEKTTTDQQTISEYLAEVTQKQEKVDAIHADAVELESKVEEYDERFQSFQRQLDDREQRFVNGTEKLDKLIARFEKQEESFDGLIAKSEDMLKSATVAGLAANYGTMQGSLDEELKSARLTFYIAIGVLIVSSIPLLALVLLPILSLFFPDTFPITSQEPRSGLYYLGEVLARVIILLPAAWFVRFASRRHGALFKLREDYAYKYSMAVSVEGFKKQAPDYESEIAAIVFEQLAFNPAENMSGTEKKDNESPNKLMTLLQDKFSKAIDTADD